jgi:hypothetical protein
VYVDRDQTVDVHGAIILVPFGLVTQ